MGRLGGFSPLTTSSHTPMNLISGLVDRTSSSQAKIALFRSLFRGREDIYPITIEFYDSLPSLAVSNDASPIGWSQKWAHELTDAANCSENSTSNPLPAEPWCPSFRPRRNRIESRHRVRVLSANSPLGCSAKSTCHG